ncbi:DUF3021 domain-containing protein [Allobacillus sp. GCM10007491]|uniref:DUF3021 domain-containing protein n=1 Tax=Allobacillus saliphilus TaxID=2912308 RepID=A0A941CUJ1_9BACI|nr:DUF3021 domain-containing protein [Allobacillus saliphilus]MBR7553454.1 DUF3021 domain-containing protein [Allobacillus saliphilus]
MIAEAFKRSISGIAFAALFTFIFITVLLFTKTEANVFEIWKGMFGALIMGIYFGSASLIFENERWSPLKQTIIHFFLSVTVWLPLALLLGWVPVGLIPIAIGLGGFVFVYAVFWFVLQSYFSKVEKDLNEQIKRT